MSFWTAIVIIVAIGVLSEMYKVRLKTSLRESEGNFKNISQRTARLEERMANIETLVLDKERQKDFRDLN